MENVLTKLNDLSASLPLRTRKPRGQGGSRRGEILNAAKRLFLEEGFFNATMRRIAAMVGVSPTAIYLHFADKDAILQAIAEDFFAELLDALEAATAVDLPPLERLRRGLRTFVGVGLARPDEYRLTFQAWAAVPSDVEHPKPETADKSFHILEDAVVQLMDAGIFRRDDPMVVAEAIFCSLHGVTSAILAKDTKLCSDKTTLTNAVIEMTLNGFLTQAARA